MISDPNSNIFTKGVSQLWHTASQLWHRVTIVTSLEILVLIDLKVPKYLGISLVYRVHSCSYLSVVLAFQWWYACATVFDISWTSPVLAKFCQISNISAQFLIYYPRIFQICSFRKRIFTHDQNEVVNNCSFCRTQ